MSKLTTAITDLSTEFTELVNSIEGQTPLTMNHYDQYMVAISRLTPEGSPEGLPMVVGLALVEAGANPQGIIAALRALGHNI